MPKRKDQLHPADPRGDDAEVIGAVSNEDVKAAKPAFLTAIANAKTELSLTARRHDSAVGVEEQAQLDQRDAARRQRLTLVRRVAYAAAAAALVLLSCGGLVALIMLFMPKPIEATPELGLHGLVKSTFAPEPPVAGVEIRRISTDQEGTSTSELLTSTNASGMFYLDQSETNKIGQCDLYYDGEPLGTTFQTGPECIKARGSDTFKVDVQPERIKHEILVTLKPGETNEPIPGLLRVSLSSGAKAVWTGKLVEDRNWPSNFTFGQIAGGIYKLDGTPSKDLRIIAFVSDDILKSFATSANRLRLIAQSEQYRIQDEFKKYKGEETGWRAGFHRGWFVTSHPPCDFLLQQSLRIEKLSPTTDESRGAWVSWQALPQTQYAILAPFAADGHAEGCWIDTRIGKVHNVNPGIRILGQHKPLPIIYDILYYDPKRDEYFTYGQYCYRPSRESYWSLDDQPRGYFQQANFSLPLPEILEHGSGPGQFWILQMDFTMTEPQVYGPVTYNATKHRGKYNIKFQVNKIGEVTRMRLLGNRQMLAQPPAWDYDCDNVADGFGNDAELPVYHAASIKVRVVLREKCGNTILLERSIYFPPPGILGYEPDTPVDNVVMAGIAQPRPDGEKLRVISVNSVANQAAYSYSVSQLAGPALFIDPPAKFHDTPLKEYRIWLYARAAGGDAELMYIYPYINFGTLTGSKLMPVNGNYPFPLEDGIPSPINIGGNGYNIEEAIKRDNNPKSEETPLQYLLRQYYNDESIKMFHLISGIDLYNPPSDQNLLVKLYELRNSNKFTVKFANSKIQQLYWTESLRGIELPSDKGFLLRIKLNDYNWLYAGQWDIYSGAPNPSRIELETVDGEIYKAYYDFSGLGGESTPVKP
jgi:hypothetical protein